MNAQELVNQLLEGSPYDVDDPLEKNEIPAGFIARRETDRMEVRYDGQSAAKGYRFSKFWIDPYTGKERVLRDGIFHPVSANNAAAYLAAEMKRWRDGGWEVEEL